jgi:hypothetical protein
MILPYDGSERESQTPSPPSQLVYLTNLNARYNAADPHAGSARPKKNFSRHRAHDDVNARRLSDIGEEMSPARSEVFDDLELSRHQQQRHMQGSRGSPLPRSQLTVSETQDSGNAARSSSSSSTVSARSGRTSGEASSPQTASETSPNANAAESAAKTGSGDEAKMGAGLPDSSIVASAVKGKGPGEDLSSAILSSEAERILENAKKRLTVRGESGHSIIGNDGIGTFQWESGKLTCFTVDGGQFESRTLSGASVALAFAVFAG